jgi:hypothetical protein
MNSKRIPLPSGRPQSGSCSDALIGLLEQFLQQDGHPPELLLLMADIYQRRTGHAAKAISFLREYLKVRDEPEVRARLRTLEGRLHALAIAAAVPLTFRSAGVARKGV